MLKYFCNLIIITITFFIGNIMNTSLYTIKNKGNKIYVNAPYNYHMLKFFRSIKAKWKESNWVAHQDYHDIIVNELTYVFGEPNDVAVDLKIDVGTLTIRDKLFIADLKCIDVDVLEKKFLQTSNLYIYNEHTYNNWQKVDYSTVIAKHFFTRLIVSFFRPFKIKDCTFLLSNISKTRAQNFIDMNHHWVKNASIVPGNNNEFHE